MFRKLLVVVFIFAPLGLIPLLRYTPTGPVVPYNPPLPNPMVQEERVFFACFSIFPGQAFPATLPWEPLRDIGQRQSHALEELAKNKPLEFLQMCLDRYDRDVKSYRLLFVKQERVGGKLRPAEKVLVHFKEKPFSVHFDWKEGADQAFGTIYVEGENAGRMLIRPNAFGFKGPIITFPVDSAQAKATSRFPITQFGMRCGTVNTLKSMYAAEKAGKLHLKYDGIKMLKAVGRRCYVFVRDPYDPIEDDGIAKMTIYLDTETLLQVGSELRDAKGDTIADYYFRDIELNPTFSDKQFLRGSL